MTENFHAATLLRWTQLWQSILPHVKVSALNGFNAIMNRYSEPHRHYHNLQHLEECLVELDRVRTLAKQPTVLEMALWFHDVVYETEAGSTNEELSADFAVEALRKGGADESVIRDVRSLILVTKNHVPNQTADSDLICDIDLAILGREESRFWAYEQAIRREYEWVPAADYLKGRAGFLENFLERKRLYVTDVFYDRYETTARRNLANSLAHLQAGKLPW